MRPLSVYYKYVYYLRKYATLKKLNNILYNKLELSKRKSRLGSLPYKITIDPGNFCNLRCPGCHTGIKHSEMIEPSFLKFENYKKIFAQVKDHAISVALYNWGEPFLNKQIFDMIAHSTENNVGTTLHSNFNVFNEKMAEDAVKSGLTHIYVSIDGASQDAYSKYRVRGNLDNVMENLSILLETKKRHKSKFPIVTWKFLIFDHNKHELEIAKEKALSSGVDAFESFQAYPKLTDIYEQALDYKLNPDFKLSTQVCNSLWSSIYIHADGSVLPCSLAFRENECFGNVLQEDISQVWNNSAYMSSRRMFSGDFIPDEVPLPCRACKFYLSRTCSIALKS